MFLLCNLPFVIFRIFKFVSLTPRPKKLTITVETCGPPNRMRSFVNLLILMYSWGSKHLFYYEMCICLQRSYHNIAALAQVFRLVRSKIKIVHPYFWYISICFFCFFNLFHLFSSSTNDRFSYLLTMIVLFRVFLSFHNGLSPKYAKLNDYDTLL